MTFCVYLSYAALFLCSSQIISQGSKFRLSVSPGQVDFPTDNNISNISCPAENGIFLWRTYSSVKSLKQPGSRQAPSLVSARHILVSDFNGIPLIQSRQAWQFLLWSPLKQLLSSVHYTTRWRFRNAGRPPFSSGVTAESPAAIALIGCWAPAVIGFPGHPGNLLELSVSSAFAFSSCK